eukprot:TRINITY_DN41388_c0_g1_i3.p1 TRINITY_DN41388_c0_g1~~TRINITY_DN41388_c0_g1_i3.p1  ORF type:complete len:239 (+),score=11.46 TRINITY_DN41388_c0_g1_i3:86-718(+)
MTASSGVLDASMYPSKLRSPVFALAVAVLAVSSAAPLSRCMHGEVHPVTIAFWRVAIVGICLFPSIRLTVLDRRVVFATGLAGFFLAAHFWSFFAALSRTSVLRATLLVSVDPLWTGLLQWLLLGTGPSYRYWLGILLALVGVCLMVKDAPMGRESDLRVSLGDALAMMASFFGAVYLLICAAVRRTVDTGTTGSMVQSNFCGRYAVQAK